MRLDRDENSCAVLGVVDTNGDIASFPVDSDDKVVAYVHVVSSVPTYPASYQTTDDNGISVLFGVDDNGVARPFLIDNSNNGIVATFD